MRCDFLRHGGVTAAYWMVNLPQLSKLGCGRYRIRLPLANHVFLPGHRLMVQIQSTWFPLYDRNPQTYVENIFFAQRADYRPATHTIYHRPNQASAIELPVVDGPKN